MTPLPLARLAFEDMGTLGDAARSLGVKPNVVGNWANRYPDFPPPLGTIGRAEVYHLPTVTEWCRIHRSIA